MRRAIDSGGHTAHQESEDSNAYSGTYSGTTARVTAPVTSV